MSRNQQSIWHHNRQQQDILSTIPTRLELLSERATDSELCTAETLRRTQEELQWFRRLYENIPSVYFSLDATGIILSVNHFGANCLGYTSEQLINKPVCNLFEQSDQQKLSDAFKDLLKALPNNEVTNWEFRLNCPASKIVWVRAVVRILPAEEGNHDKKPVILMVCEDITADKQADDHLREGEQGFHTIANTADITEHKFPESALERIQEAARSQLEEMESLKRLKNEFINTVSHELRTPLTNMKMAIQMLGIALHQEQNFLSEMAKPQAERSKAARYFEILDNECEREINLINNFLDLQRLDTGAKSWVLETIQVQQWLWRVVELFKAQNNSYQQNLHLKVAPNLPLLACDPFSLERILIELLTNACKFSPPNAEITVSAQLKSQNIQFQVINSGVEIPAVELARIFDKFYRIPSNDPWKQGGTGLGLALVEKLTKQMGGTIEVESGSNRTCFIIQLASK
ncbi:PAS domain-containing sensor histidine kinase [aff. Roholtiella sp. LEGE 12411]|uniref:PAS domain-containing sensor histidine kinase n=1 Tax=aff. Roholtiella sp. LEGE 12411 TaxID=1828822 RepID=UPI0018830130|nr:PAS domain-containing sensor histidine kinase [aff. Roholtiella sp. LEGE 12411]MBE9037334.1 PAS domain S-box protein [aff. Roholtiella sp. LEGE 12411]